jgi:hypothetical protein
VALAQSPSPRQGEPLHELIDERGQRLPLVRERLVAGRSVECDIRLSDEFASRRQFKLTRTPAGWQIEDLYSTNGTSLNGRRLQPGVPVPLALTDRITVGHTSLVMQRSLVGPRPAPHEPRGSEHDVDRSASQRAGGSARSEYAMANRPYPETARSAIPLWQWILSALIAVAAALLVYGAFQPWVRVQVRLAFEGVTGGELLNSGLALLNGVLQDVFKKPPLVTANAVEISGTNSYGWFTLLAGCVAALMAVLDLGLHLKRSMLPGIVYLLAALLPGVLLAGDVQRLARLGTIPILFGVNLLDIFRGASEILEPKVTPLAGLYMTAIGLALLLGAGLLRSTIAALSRRSIPALPVS